MEKGIQMNVRATIAVCLLLFPIASIMANPIHEAVEQGDIEAVREILGTSPDQVGIKDARNNMPLHLAASGGNLEIVKMLVEAGADVNAGDNENDTPLHISAMDTSKAAISYYLLEHGASVNYEDQFKTTPFHFAAIGGDIALISLMLDKGANVNAANANRITPLCYAAGRRHPEAVRLLLSKGADINHIKNHGERPVFDAARGGLVEIMEIFIQNGADINVVDSNNIGLLVPAAEFDRNVDMISFLINKGLDPNAASNNGLTPLLLASWRGNINIARALLDHGASPNIASESGELPLHSAVESKNLELCELFLGTGASANAAQSKTGYSPLHLAAINGNKEAAELLLSKGADLAVRDIYGNTPLFHACKYGHKQMADLLEAKGANDTGLERNFGFSPQLREQIGNGEAYIWYLGHSGWAVKTTNNLLIFDYWEGTRRSSEPLLANGIITAEEIKDHKVTVFVSHADQDHYDTTIFKWRESVPGIEYVFGFNPGVNQDYTLLEGRQNKKIGNMEISTIISNDLGVGFLVKVDDITIFHAGDHANRFRDFSGPFKDEIDYIADMKPDIDFAFMPISGCRFGDLEAVRLGVNYTLEKLTPKAFFPQHALNAEWRYQDFADQADAKLKEKTGFICARNCGDRFFYRKGAISF